jgi:hypothetical protein
MPNPLLPEWTIWKDPHSDIQARISPTKKRTFVQARLASGTGRKADWQLSRYETEKRPGNRSSADSSQTT